MEWTLANIRAKVRSLTGRPDEEVLSTSTLNNYINHYYQYVFPLEALPPELHEWFTLNTNSANDTYSLNEKYLTLVPPFTIDGWPIRFYLNPSEFYRQFPKTQEWTKMRPTHVLLMGQQLIFRPPPDGTYLFEAQTIGRPDPLNDDTDKPLNQLWGPVIAYGSAIDIKNDNGEFEENSPLAELYQEALNKITRSQHILFQSQRSIPRF